MNPNPTATISRAGLFVLFVTSGVLHLLYPAPFLRIVPPMLPWPEALVAISGCAEIAGGVAVLIPRWRTAAGWGLVMLLIAVFPANFYMAYAHLPAPGVMGETWAQWARLPLQFILIAWVWRAARLVW